MLVLTRKLGAKIIIDGNITVQVVQIKNKQVRLGIEAPSNIKVHREEVYKQIKEDKK